MAVIAQPIMANSFEGYANGTQPGANLGGAGGTPGNLGTINGFGWDTVVVSAGSTMLIDNTKSHSGSQSVQFSTTSGVSSTLSPTMPSLTTTHGPTLPGFSSKRLSSEKSAVMRSSGSS